jgi:3-hydroxybutyryl-CoA dehydrogenase
MSFEKIFVAGCGTMGNGIAQVCAQNGLSVVMYDIKQELLDNAVKKIQWSVSKLAEKGKISDTADDVMGRIVTATDVTAAKDADLVIEAIFENLDVKHQLFKQLDEVIGTDTIVASNTSAIPISALAAGTQRPDKFLGIHFFNPVPMMMAVEVIKGISTSDKTLSAGAEFVRFIGKEPIMVLRDIAGFVLNRMNMLTNMEAMRLVENGVATPEDIDKGVRLAFGRKMGPLETSDLVGLDVQHVAAVG